MAWAKYRSDETIACAAWGCWAMALLVFTIVFIFTVWPTMSEEMTWTKDECFVVSHLPNSFQHLTKPTNSAVGGTPAQNTDSVVTNVLPLQVSHNTSCLDLKLGYCGPAADVFLLSRDTNNLVCTTVWTPLRCARN
jgi:hypothetical protein